MFSIDFDFMLGDGEHDKIVNKYKQVGADLFSYITFIVTHNKILPITLLIHLLLFHVKLSDLEAYPGRHNRHIQAITKSRLTV